MKTRHFLCIFLVLLTCCSGCMSQTTKDTVLKYQTATLEELKKVEDNLDCDKPGYNKLTDAIATGIYKNITSLQPRDAAEKIEMFRDSEVQRIALEKYLDKRSFSSFSELYPLAKIANSLSPSDTQHLRKLVRNAGTKFDAYEQKLLSDDQMSVKELYDMVEGKMIPTYSVLSAILNKLKNAHIRGTDPEIDVATILCRVVKRGNCLEFSETEALCRQLPTDMVNYLWLEHVRRFGLKDLEEAVRILYLLKNADESGDNSKFFAEENILETAWADKLDVETIKLYIQDKIPADEVIRLAKGQQSLFLLGLLAQKTDDLKSSPAVIEASIPLLKTAEEAAAFSFNFRYNEDINSFIRAFVRSRQELSSELAGILAARVQNARDAAETHADILAAVCAKKQAEQN